MSVATKFLTTTSTKLSSISIVDGQVIALSDRNAWFYDMGGVRHSVTGNEYCSGNLPAVGHEGTLYVLSDANENSGIYVWTGTDFSKIAVNSVFVGATAVDGKAGLVPAPTTADGGKFLRGDGTWSNPVNTEYSEMTGATSTANGSSGLVPAPTKADRSKFLAGDGTWKDVETTDTKNTAGATQSTEKLFIIGAENQSANPETFSNSKAYVTDGKLHSNSKEVVNLSDSQALTNKTYEGYTLGNVVSKDLATAGVTENGTSIPTAGQVYTAVQQALNDAKTYTNTVISGVIQFKIEVVDTLPATGVEATIYLVPSDKTGADNVKVEYLYINGAWEIIGSTQVDLSVYSTTTEMNAAISSAVTTALADYVPRTDLDGFVRKDQLEAEATKSLPAVATSGSYNDLKDKPSIPTKLSDLVQDKVLLTDDVTGIVYQLGVSNGKICITEVE